MAQFKSPPEQGGHIQEICWDTSLIHTKDQTKMLIGTMLGVLERSNSVLNTNNLSVQNVICQGLCQFPGSLHLL